MKLRNEPNKVDHPLRRAHHASALATDLSATPMGVSNAIGAETKSMKTVDLRSKSLVNRQICCLQQNSLKCSLTCGSNPALSAIPHDLHETFLSIGNFYLIADDEVGFEQGVLKRVYPIHGMP